MKGRRENDGVWGMKLGVSDGDGVRSPVSETCMKRELLFEVRFLCFLIFNYLKKLKLI